MIIDTSVVYVDCETTGLDPDRHEIWDLAIITGDGTEYDWHLRPNLKDADPGALRITDFYRRTADWDRLRDLGDDAPAWETPNTAYYVPHEVARLTSGKHLVGAVPSFDAAFIERLLRKAGLVPAWHYHLIDVESLAAGKLGLPPPWSSDDLAEKLGVPRLDGKHTALGDARWAMKMYEAVMTR